MLYGVPPLSGRSNQTVVKPWRADELDAQRDYFRSVAALASFFRSLLFACAVRFNATSCD